LQSFTFSLDTITFQPDFQVTKLQGFSYPKQTLAIQKLYNQEVEKL
jgi:hypothetical protein